MTAYLCHVFSSPTSLIHAKPCANRSTAEKVASNNLPNVQRPCLFNSSASFSFIHLFFALSSPCFPHYFSREPTQRLHVPLSSMQTMFAG